MVSQRSQRTKYIVYHSTCIKFQKRPHKQEKVDGWLSRGALGGGISEKHGETVGGLWMCSLS
jgi:hypothetical protein